MKFDLCENKYIIYLNKYILNDVDFKIKKQVEACFKDVFLKIKRRLNKDINGFFNIKVYLNKDFGAVVIMEKEILDYYDYFSNQIDMQIEIDYDSYILLKLNDFFDIDSSFYNVYLYKNEFYIKYIDNLKYLEFTNIVYGEEADEIINNSKIIYCH